MKLEIEDVLKGETIIRYDRMDLPFEEMARKEHEQQVRLIQKGAMMMPKHLTRKEAETSLAYAGSEYGKEWLDANESKLDPDDLFWLTIEAYSGAPYGSIPKKRIIGLRKIRPDDYLKDLNPELVNTDPIIVYRGSCNLPVRVKNEFSWTTDPITAIFFYSKKKETFERITHGKGITKDNVDDLHRYGVMSEPKVWKGTIEKDKIIATYNERGEYEVLQHCNVKNVQGVALTDNEIDAALEKWKSQVRAWNEQERKKYHEDQ